MNNRTLTRLTGLLFVIGALVVNIPYSLLIANFHYPDILRQPSGEVLAAFAQDGQGLIFTWLAFAWSGLPLLLAILLVPHALGRENDPLIKTATALGVIGAVVQMAGLLRWVFVVPGLAAAYISPNSSLATRESAAIIFRAFHQLGGVLLGEHLGQAFTIGWMILLSLGLLRARLFTPWLAWLGLIGAGIYSLAQGELLATVIPGFPQVGPAGLAGSVLWLAWMLFLGIALLRGYQASWPLALARQM